MTWAWFAIIISIYSAAFTSRNFFQHSNGMQLTMGWLMMGSIAASAAGSFRRERETGVLELLLVAPLTTNQIIAARVRGLWGQFLPALGTLLGVWLYFAGVFNDWADMRWVWFFAVTFLTLPVIGLYFSVRCRHFVSAFLLTLVTALGLPFALSPVISFIAFIYTNALTASYDKFAEKLWAVPSLVQGALALLTATLLRRRLGRRNFPLERTAL